MVAIDGFHSIISSFIFFSTNEDLLKYVLDLCLSIEYTEILTNENRDPVPEHQDKLVSIQLTNDRSLRLTLTSEANVYLEYLEKENDVFIVKYGYKAYKPVQYNALTVFCQMGMPQNHWWCETPACTKYYTGDFPIDEYMQETIVKTFIDYKSPLSEYYEKGTKFSGFIRKSLGRFNGKYAVIVDGCGLYYTECEEEETIDGVNFKYSNGNRIYLIGAGLYSLEKALEEGIITHGDLVILSNRLSGKIKASFEYSEEKYLSINIDRNYFYVLTSKEDYDFLAQNNNLNFLPLSVTTDDFYLENDCLFFIIVEPNMDNQHTINPKLIDHQLHINYHLDAHGALNGVGYWCVVLTAPKECFSTIDKVILRDEELTLYNISNHIDD